MKKSVFLLCSAHIDPVWLWPREEGVTEALATFETAARFCREYDGFVFNHNEALLYEWVERYDPELFAQIQSLVREGRWHIMGGWYLQPDCNMPSGESIVHQILEGRRYFWEKFGVSPRTAINFDSFGHSRGLAQILKKAGYDSYIVCRPGENDFPTPASDFLWEGYDGSQVLVHRTVDGYQSGYGKAGLKADKYLEMPPENGPYLCLWGVGNHGGGPSKVDLEELGQRIAQNPGLCHATPEEFFDAVRRSRPELPVVARPMNHWGVGCYTSEIRVKKLHRKLEGEYFFLEKMAVQASRLGAAPYPAAELSEIRKDLLFLEFHDILPGSSAERSEQQSLRTAAHGLEAAARKKLDLFLSMTWGRVSPESPVTPIYLYNPHPVPVRGIFEYELQLPHSVKEGFAQPVLTWDQKPVSVQREKEDNMVPIQWRRKMAFYAELPPASMSRMEFHTEILPEQPKAGSVTETPEALQFSNGRITVRINRRTGFLDAYQVDGKDYLKEGSFAPVVFENIHDSWGMTLQKYDKPLAPFRLRTMENGGPELRVIEDGCVRAVVEGVLEYGRSLMVVQYFLPMQGTEVEVRLNLTFAEDTRLVKLALYPAESPFEFLGETVYGTETLAQDQQEEAAQKWLAAAGETSCLTLINDGVYGSSCDGNALYQTLISSCGYSAHPMEGRQHVPEDRYVQNSDHIRTEYRFWINGGPREERLAAVSGEALIRQQPPMVLAAFSGKCQGSRGSMWEVDNPAVTVPAVKQAENGSGIVFRLFNSGSQGQTACLRMGQSQTKLTFGPYELKTVLWDGEQFLETDLLEGLYHKSANKKSIGK